MPASVTLRGITWNHSRGLLPLVATGQRFSELNPGVEVIWEKRSLVDFELYPVEQLAERYDLMIIDHPHIGWAAETGVFLPLDGDLPDAFLADQAKNSVGASHASYCWNDRQWALAIDAACPVMAWRPDLLARPPSDWAELLQLARSGLVEVPSVPVNAFVNFIAFCTAHGASPCVDSSQVVERAVGLQALAGLGELMSLVEEGARSRDPILSLDLLASESNRKVAICLFPYGYSNYSRRGYAFHRLRFTDTPVGPAGRPFAAVLGGTGLALSARSSLRAVALRYAAYVASPAVQRTIYTEAGGQPGHRSAWLDPENNSQAWQYFAATLPALDRAWLRPRHAGFIRFQEQAGLIIHAHLAGKAAKRESLDQLDSAWKASMPAHSPI